MRGLSEIGGDAPELPTVNHRAGGENPLGKRSSKRPQEWDAREWPRSRAQEAKVPLDFRPLFRAPRRVLGESTLLCRLRAQRSRRVAAYAAPTARLGQERSR